MVVVSRTSIAPAGLRILHHTRTSKGQVTQPESVLGAYTVALLSQKFLHHQRMMVRLNPLCLPSVPSSIFVTRMLHVRLRCLCIRPV